VRDLAKLFRTSSWPLANVKAGVASLTFPVYHKPCLFARHYTRQLPEHGPGLSGFGQGLPAELVVDALAH
jgi:hypothetical protein